MYKKVQETLFSLQDKEFQKFQQKLVPTVSPKLIIGVRTPEIKKLAKEMVKDKSAEEYIAVLPHKYLEEYILHGAIINLEKNFDAAINKTERLLPYIDNWMTCDLLSPKVFGKNPDIFMRHIDMWLCSDEEYTVRFGMKMLMTFFLDDNFSPEYSEKVINANNDKQYVSLMTAWYFATALAKQYDSTIPYIENKALDAATHNKAIQKAIESYRVTDEHKAYLRTLKVGKNNGRRS